MNHKFQFFSPLIVWYLVERLCFKIDATSAVRNYMCNDFSFWIHDAASLKMGENSFQCAFVEYSPRQNKQFPRVK